MPGSYLTDDLADMFDNDDFAVTVTPATGATFAALFDNGYREVPAGLGEMDSREPSILAPASSLTAIVAGAVLTIGGVSYTALGIPEPEDDGLVSRVRLRRTT